MTRVGRLDLFQDEDAFGPKEYPQRPFPRGWRRFSLPLGPYALGTIELPDSMMPVEWERMMRFLEVMRPGIVHDEIVAATPE